jgi:hypothetical protein
MMLATETRVQVSILGYLSSDLKEAVGRIQLSVISYQFTEKTPYTLHPTPYTLHPTPHTLHPTCHFPEKAYSAIQAKKNETFALRISPDW